MTPDQSELPPEHRFIAGYASVARAQICRQASEIVLQVRSGLMHHEEGMYLLGQLPAYGTLPGERAE